MADESTLLGDGANDTNSTDTGNDEGGSGTDKGEGSGGTNEGGDGGQPHWSEALPEDYREAFSGFEDWDTASAALKGPAVPETYQTPEGVQIDTETFESFSGTAKELGLTQEQMNGLIKFDGERGAKINETIMAKVDTDMQAGLDEMKSNLGEAKFNEAVAGAKKVIDTFGDDGLKEWLDSSRVGNSSKLISFLAKVGAGLSEDSFDTAGSKNNSMSDAPLEDRMFADVDFGKVT